MPTTNYVKTFALPSVVVPTKCVNTFAFPGDVVPNNATKIVKVPTMRFALYSRSKVLRPILSECKNQVGHVRRVFFPEVAVQLLKDEVTFGLA